MSTMIVAYDHSPNADDALALAEVLAGHHHTQLALAHVYDSQPAAPAAGTPDSRDRFLRARAEELLSAGAERLAGDVRRIAAPAPTTASGIRDVAEREVPALVVFGSANRTQHGHVRPGSASRRLLRWLRCPIAFAPVGYQERPAGALRTVGFALDDDTGAARSSAESLARVARGRVVEHHEAELDLLVLGSSPDAERGQLMVNAPIDQLIRRSTVPVLVVPRAKPLELGAARADSVAA